MLDKLPFLASTRFWAIIVMALAIWGGALGWLPADLVSFVELVTAGHIGIRTTDRAFENFKKK